jgi:hypothetical protein
MHLADGPEEFVFHLEDDFTFNRPVHLGAMADVLDREPEPRAARAAPPSRGTTRSAPPAGSSSSTPTTTPTVPTSTATSGSSTAGSSRRTRRSTAARSALAGWPQVDSEGVFTHQLLADPDVRFGFWGPRHSGEWVTHIGDERVGRYATEAFCAPIRRLPGDMVHLWHPRLPESVPGSVGFVEQFTLVAEYRDAAAAGTVREYVEAR